jgi:DNA polymerase V
MPKRLPYQASRVNPAARRVLQQRWRVSGDSLEAEGILDGDLIAVDRAGKRRHGRIVVAVVDGAITVKKLAKREGRWFLDPRARADGYATIPVTETTEIWGVVAGVVRRLPIE